jgi:hypothetical protein
MVLPEKPTSLILNEYLGKWHTLENYMLQENALNLLFTKLCPSNTVIENILLKVCTLNDFYSTMIFDTYTVAKHLLHCDIDKGLNEGDINLVDKIKPIMISGKQRNLYSFASKYCSHHKPEVYPIYDSYVEKMLWYFKNKHFFSEFKKYELKDYRNFLRVIQDFRSFYNLTNYSLRQIDIYLWLAGKKFFPNKY